MSKKEDLVDRLTNHPFVRDGSMNELLDLPPVEVKQYLVEMREKCEDDLETVRAELHDIMSGLKTSFYQQLEQAAQVPLPRAHEVIATTAEKRIHAVQALAELHEQMNHVPDGPRVVNNTLNVSSAEMLDMMKKRIAENGS